MIFFQNVFIKTIKKQKKAISRIIQVYNQMRPHASIDFLTPDQAHLKDGPIKKRWKHYSNYQKQKEVIMIDVE